MAQDFIFGIDIEASISNNEEAIQALQKLKKEIDDVSKGVKIDVSEEDIAKAKLQVSALEKTIEELKNSGGEFGDVFSKNLKTVQTEFKETAQAAKKTTKEVQELNKATQGQNNGFSNISKTAKIATRDIQGASTQIDNLKQNLQQGVGQTLAFGAINMVGSAIGDAVDNAKQLDTIMTDISIVSGKSNEQMEKYRDYAGQAADALGTMGSEYLEASLIYEQQGGIAAYYAKDLADATVIAANISRESTSQMSEYLTATINGFDLLRERGGGAGTYITDVLAKLGAASGSDLAEIATGLTRTANTARDVKFEFEEIATMIATVSEVTRRTPETIGNAFKSMLTTFTQLREAGDEEVEAFTNKVEEAFKLGGIEGISVFDNGRLRDASAIFKDIAGEWHTMNVEQQSLVSEAVAGKYQAETFRAFMNNQDRYNELLEQAYESGGTAAQQQLIYMDSIEAKLKQMDNQWEIIATNIIDSDMFKGIIDDATNLLKIIGAQENALFTLGTALTPVVGIFGQLFGAKFVGEAVQGKQLGNLQKSMIAEAEVLRVKNGEVGEEMYRQVSAGQELNKVMSTLGKDAGNNFKELVEEADRLKERIDAINVGEEGINQLIEERTKLMLTTGGAPGLQGGKATALVNEEQSKMLSENTVIPVLEKEVELEQRKLDIISKAKTVDSESFDNKVRAAQVAVGLTKDNIFLEEKNKDIIEETGRELEEWLSIRKSVKKNSDESKDINHEILLLQEKINEAVKKEASIRESVKKSKSSQVEQEKNQIKFEASRRVVEADVRKEVSNLDNMQATVEMNERIQEGYTKAAKKTEWAAKATQGLSFAYSTLVPIAASANAVMKDQISVQDGVISSMQSVGSMLMFAPGLWTKAGGAAVLALSWVVDKLDLFKTKAEKAKETNDSLIRSFLSLQETTQAELDTIRNLEESYTRFQGVDASSFLARDEIETEDLAEYLDLSQKISEIRPDLIKYYDDEGRAIVDLSQKYEDLVAIQKQSVTEAFGVLASGRETFLIQYSEEVAGARKEIESFIKESKEAKEALQESKLQGDAEGISSALATITEVTNKVSEAQRKITDVGDLVNTNILQPFYASNSALRNINDELEISSSKLKDFGSNLIDSSTMTGFIQSGDEASANAILDNLSLIYDKYYEIAKISGEEGADKFLSSITESSEFAKTALFKAQLSVEDLMKSLEIKSNSTTWLEGLAIVNIDNVEKSSVEIDKLQEKIEKFEGKLEKQISRGDDYGVKVISEELDRLHGKMLKLKGEASFEYTNNLEEVVADFDKASRSAKGFEEALEEIGKQETSISAIQDILKNGMADGSLNALAEYAPKIAEGLQNGKIDAQEALDSIVDLQNSAITGMMMNNQAYYEDWKQGNLSQIQGTLDSFGLQLESASTLAEAKVMLEGATTEQLRAIASQQVDDAIAKDEAIDKSNRVKFANMTTVSGIWGDSTLTMWEKIKITVLNILDELANGFSNMVSGVLNGMVDLYEGSPKWLQKAGSFIGIDSDEMRKNANNGNVSSSTLADDERKKIADRQKLEREEREKLIQDILDGNGTGSNTDLFKNNANKYISSSLSSLNIPKLDKDSPGANKDSVIGNKDKEDEKEVENLRLTLNQYYKLENALKKVKDQYDSLGKKKAAAYGEDKLRLMTQEQELLIKESNLLKQHSSALKQEQADAKKHLSSYGFNFDKQGEINNLNERLTALQNEANKKSGVAKEAAIAAVKSLQEEASRYSEVTFNLLPDKQKAIEAAKQTFSQIAKEKVEYSIQIKVDRYGLQREILDVVTEMQDTFEKLDEKMKYTADKASVSLNEISLLQKAMAEVRSNPALTDSDREELLQKYQRDLLSAVGNARNAYGEMNAIQQDFVSKTVEKINEVSDGYERILDKSQIMIDKVKELYGGKGFGQISGIYATQEKALESQLSHLQASQSALLKYRDTLDKNTDAWKEANSQITEIGQSIESNLIAKMDMLKAKFEDFSESLFTKFNGLFGAWGFEGASKDFDKLLDKTNQYMSSYEKMTTIGAKIKSINEEIAKTTDPKRAAELARYRDEELLTLMAQDSVSESEYERALKLYDIKQKELALQERQNASRIAQLVRDENGNMSYEYVRQETGDMKSELDDLNKAKDELYKFDSDKVQEASKKIFEIIQEYQGNLRDLESKGLSPEEYKKELDKLLAGTQAEINAQQAIVDKWMQNVGKDGFNTIMDMFGQGAISAEQLGVNDQLLSKILKGLQDGSLSYQDIMSENYDSFSASIGASSDEINSAMKKIMEVVLGDNKKVTDSLQDASNKWTSTAQENVKNLGDAYKKYMTEANRVLESYNKTTGTLNQLLDRTNSSSKNVTDSIKKQTDAMIKTKSQTDITSNSIKNLERMLIGSGNGGLFGSMIKVKNEQNEKLQPSLKTTRTLTGQLSDTVNVAGGKYKYMGERAEAARQRVIAYSDKKTKQGVKDIESAGKAASDNKTKYDKWKTSIDKTKTSMKDLISELSKLPGMQNFIGKSSGTPRLGLPNPDMIDVSKFDTGGYTGTWENSTNNSTGKMAMLHEKELVLNRYDTDNLLEAVKLQRSITDRLQNSRFGTSNTINKVNEVINNRTDNSTISQPVVIHASFPDVTSSSQIEGAFEGLLGKATIHVGKK